MRLLGSLRPRPAGSDSASLRPWRRTQKTPATAIFLILLCCLSASLLPLPQPASANPAPASLQCHAYSGASSCEEASSGEASSGDAMAADSSGVVAAPGEPAALPVVVVGGGLAGLAAAAELARHKLPVVIIEKTDRLGGNSAKASSGMNAANSAPQRAQGIEDSPELFAEDTIRSGKGLSSPELVEVATHDSADAVAFLESLGLNLSSIQQLGGHSRPRTHRAAPDGKPMNIGWRIMSTLIAHLQELEKAHPSKVKILTSSRAVELLASPASGAVTGVRAARKGEGNQEDTEDVAAVAVILATGGYSADREGLMKEYAPSLRLLPTTNGPFATGDGVRLGSALGAALVHMDQVQVHPTGLVDPQDPSNPVKILGPEILRGSGGLLFNHSGRRFVNELTTRDQVVSAMWEHCQPLDGATAGLASEGVDPVPVVVSHLVLSDEAVKKFGEAPAKFYLAKGLMKKFSSLDELIQGLGLPAAEVKASLEAYDRAAKGATQDALGKTVFPCQYSQYLIPEGAGEAPPIYSALVTPVVHYTMGGLKFDSRARVLKADAQAIPGLLAAGEVTGGLHGANRLAGNSLLECVVFGRTAAMTATGYAMELRDLLTAEEALQLRVILGNRQVLKESGTQAPSVREEL